MYRVRIMRQRLSRRGHQDEKKGIPARSTVERFGFGDESSDRKRQTGKIY